MSQPSSNMPPKAPDENAKFVPSYQTNKVPWQIHAMWLIFTIAAIIYVIRLAIPDFIHWW